MFGHGDASTPGDAGADLIVRTPTDDRDRLAELIRNHDYWGLDWRDGMAVFRMTAEDRARLEQAGVRIESDAARQAEWDRWRALNHAARLAGDPDTIPGFSCYRTVTRTHADLQALAVEFPTLAEWRDIGDTWQAGGGSAVGDSIFALVIGNTNSPHPRAPLVIMAAQHARELATAEIATRFAEQLLRNPDNDPDLAWLLDHREIHIIAQQNPDGRRQVEAGETFWRKNHNETACPGGTPGVDLNRNSPNFWGSSSSGNTCSETFRGAAPSSEPETTAVQDYLDTVFARQRPGGGVNDPAPDTAEGVFLSLHSFGEFVLLPWEGLGGQNENNAPNHDALTVLGRRMAFPTQYAVARWDLLPPAGGTMVDYAYGEFGVAAYTFEVGTSFTQSCASFESTIWPDNLQALTLAARAARRPYLEPAGPAVLDLTTEFVNGAVRVSGTADDQRFFRGNVSEPPAADPIADVVEIRIALGAPEATGAPTLNFTVAAPAPAVTFQFDLPGAVTLPANGRLFVTAVDADGGTGMPTVIEIADLLFANGFEP